MEAQKGDILLTFSSQVRKQSEKRVYKRAALDRGRDESATWPRLIFHREDFLRMLVHTNLTQQHQEQHLLNTLSFQRSWCGRI